MASFTLTNVDMFPAGTTVGAYPGSAFPAGAFGPTGSVITTQTMGATSLTFTGLVEDTDYVAAALVGARWPRVNFRVDELPNDPVFATNAEFDAHEAETTDVHGIDDTATLVRNAAFVPNDQVALDPGDAGNILKRGAAGWDAGFVEGMDVFWDENEQRWLGLFVGHSTAVPSVSQIGAAYSYDLATWTKIPENPILGPTGVVGTDPEAGILTAPHIFFEDGTYHLYYLASPNQGVEATPLTLRVATATSLLGPWTRQGQILAPGGTQWREGGVWHPNVIKVDGTYHMFINGSSSDYSLETIGHAQADSPLGPWTATAERVLDLGSGWDANRVIDPYVVRLGDYFYMYYTGVQFVTTQLVHKMGIAYCHKDDFPLGLGGKWTRHEGNPILAPSGVVGTVEGGGRGGVVITPRGVHLFYTLTDTPHFSIAHAVHGGEVWGPWRLVGATDEVAFANSWVNFGVVGVGNDAQFRKSSKGRVQIRGVVKLGVEGSKAFTLPRNYRPDVVKSWGTLSNEAFAKVVVEPDGDVIPANGNNAWHVLDGEFDLA